MLAYSAIKIRAKPPLLYSTLNPETSSDSPSAKSKGVRLVSANLDVNHMKPRGAAVNMYTDLVCIVENSHRLKLSFRTRKEIKISARLTSYEIV
jgi:predicted protein tyrosine phosphatase